MLYKGVVVPTAVYGAEAWGIREAERKKLDVFDMGCLRSMYGLTLWNRVRNEEMRRRAQMEGQLSGRVYEYQCVLRWFGHVERMAEEHMAKKVIIFDVKKIVVGVDQSWDGWMP